LANNAVNHKQASDIKSRISLANQARPQTSLPFSRTLAKTLNNSDAAGAQRLATQLNLAEAIEKMSEKELSFLVDRVINLNASQPLI